MRRRTGVTGRAIVAACVLSSVGFAGACAPGAVSPPVVQSVTVMPPPSLDTKVAWILRLEQQRVLRDVSLAAPDPAEVAPSPGFSLARLPDLAALVDDTDDLVRARSATAIGRVGLPEGVGLLQHALADPVDRVRESAAFGLGLLASRDAVPALLGALADPSPVVRGRVVEALGLIGDGAAAAYVSQAAAGCGALMAPIEPDDQEWPKSPEIELCRLALYALVRLQDFNALAQVALDAAGRPVSSWWPVAYALQRSGDPRAASALRALSTSPGVFTAGFALRGLTTLGDAASAPVARVMLDNSEADAKLRVAAVRLLGRVGGAEDVTRLARVLSQEPSSSLAVEAAAALGSLGRVEAFPSLLDAFADPLPALRAASMAAAARVNPDEFMFVLSGLGRDRDWAVRAALAAVLGTLPAERVTAALLDLASDEDARVHAAALRGLAAAKAPELADRLVASLQAEDFVERATAAELVGETRPPGGVELLIEAYARGASDSAYAARAAALEGLAAYGGPDAVTAIRGGLSDPDWPVRTRAAQLLRTLKEAGGVPERPAPLRWSADFFESDALLHPAFSPRAFIEMRRGVIEVQLNLVDAPLTVWTFVEQVRKGFFNGMSVHRLVPGFVIQTGDPRGDGSGGPGYTQRDELSPTPYLRGTVGMALDWAETGGSQWFITTSPQPHLDAKYTAFGRVVGGLDVLDRVVPGDRVERVRIWDGVDLR